MNVWKVATTALTILIFCMGQVDAKPGNGGGKPGGGGGSGCTGSEPKEPAIAYVTEWKRSGKGKNSVSTKDIMLASASGCDKYLLLIDAALQNTSHVSGLKTSLQGNAGVVAWYDTYKDPWALFYLEFTFDSDGNLFDSDGNLLIDPVVPQRFDSPDLNDIVEIDIQLSEFGEPIVAMTEWGNDDQEPEPNNFNRLTSVVNLRTGFYEVVSEGDCQVIANNDCYVPYLFSLAWNSSGDALYVGVRNSFTVNDQTGIARVRYVDGIWQPPEMIMLGVRDDAIIGQSISPGGVMAYRYDDGFLKGLRNIKIGLVDPDYCAGIICGKFDGEVGAIRQGGRLSWTSSGTLLFIPIGSGTILEYVDPINAVEGTLEIKGVSGFDAGF